MDMEKLTDEQIKDIDDNKVMAVLSYLGFLAFVPAVVAYESDFARFHANQGIVLLICEVIAAIVSWLLYLIPTVGLALSLVIGLPFFLLTVACMISGIGAAAHGEVRRLPLIGIITILR